jgi:hypothetical protein
MLSANLARYALIGVATFMTGIVPIPFESRAAEKAEPHVCDRLDLRSAIDYGKGEVGIWHDKVLGISRMRGLTGPIVWVAIVPPTPSKTDNKVLQMFVWWDTHPTTGAACRAGTDFGQHPSLNCTESISGTPLRLELTFEPTAHKAELQTEELAKYVSDDVLCALSSPD